MRLGRALGPLMGARPVRDVLRGLVRRGKAGPDGVVLVDQICLSVLPEVAARDRALVGLAQIVAQEVARRLLLDAPEGRQRVEGHVDPTLPLDTDDRTIEVPDFTELARSARGRNG